MIRFLAFIGGLILVAAAAHGTISSTGGYGTPQSFATLAMAAGVVIGASVIGFAPSWRIALCIFVGMLAGEGYALYGTANRVVMASDALQAPLKDARQRHDAAVQALADARAMKPLPASRDRLDAAEKAKADADKAAREQAALPGCRKNCAELLQSAVNSATREVNAARDELYNHDQLEAQRLAGIVAKAERDLADAPLPASSTPFADRVGLPAWALDLMSAFLLSLGLNVMAAGLFAFAAHSPNKKKPEPTKIEATPVLEPAPIIETPKKSTNVVKLPAPVKVPTFDVLDFGASNLEAAPGDTLDFDEFFNAYAAAAKASEMRAYGPTEFVEPFKKLCDEAGISVRRRGQKVFLCDVKLAS